MPKKLIEAIDGRFDLVDVEIDNSPVLIKQAGRPKKEVESIIEPSIEPVAKKARKQREPMSDDAKKKLRLRMLTGKETKGKLSEKEATSILLLQKQVKKIESEEKKSIKLAKKELKAKK